MNHALCIVKTSYFCKLPCILQNVGVISAVKGDDNIPFLIETQRDWLNWLTREKLNFHKVFLQARRQRVDDQTNIKETHLKPLL